MEQKQPDSDSSTDTRTAPQDARAEQFITGDDRDLLLCVSCFKTVVQSNTKRPGAEASIYCTCDPDNPPLVPMKLDDLDVLSDVQRADFIACELTGYGRTEWAEQHGIDRGSVSRNVQRAREKIRDGRGLSGDSDE